MCVVHLIFSPIPHLRFDGGFARPCSALPCPCPALPCHSCPGFVQYCPIPSGLILPSAPLPHPVIGFGAVGVATLGSHVADCHGRDGRWGDGGRFGNVIISGRPALTTTACAERGKGEGGVVRCSAEPCLFSFFSLCMSGRWRIDGEQSKQAGRQTASEGAERRARRRMPCDPTMTEAGAGAGGWFLQEGWCSLAGRSRLGSCSFGLFFFPFLICIATSFGVVQMIRSCWARMLSGERSEGSRTFDVIPAVSLSPALSHSIAPCHAGVLGIASMSSSHGFVQSSLVRASCLTFSLFRSGSQSSFRGLKPVRSSVVGWHPPSPCAALQCLHSMDGLGRAD